MPKRRSPGVVAVVAASACFAYAQEPSPSASYCVPPDALVMSNAAGDGARISVLHGMPVCGQASVTTEPLLPRYGSPTPSASASSSACHLNDAPLLKDNQATPGFVSGAALYQSLKERLAHDYRHEFTQLSYVMGAIDAVGGSSVCLPGRSGSNEVIDVVLKYMDDRSNNPQMLDAPAAQVVVAAAKERWPCKG